MTAQKGALVLIKAGNGATPEVFTTIGGLHASDMMLGNHLLDMTNRESGAWRQLLGSAGIHIMRISGVGLFTDAASEEMIRGYAFSGTANNYRFIFANGAYVTGSFIVSAYARSGSQDAEELYSVTLESAGAIDYTAV